MRIVIEQGDAVTIESRGAMAAAAAAGDAIDGGGAPTELIRQFGDGAELAAAEGEEPSEGEDVEAGEAPLNPLRAGEERARRGRQAP